MIIKILIMVTRKMMIMIMIKIPLIISYYL